MLRGGLMDGSVRNTEDSDSLMRDLSLELETLEPKEAPVRRLGDYELLEELGQGGMGVVWRARQCSLNRLVALKTLLLGAHAGQETILRFQREAQAIAALDHPGIVAIHEIGHLDGLHYFAMDLVEGLNLAERIRGQPIAPHRAARYTATIADAIQYAHEHGILHRDLKPSNILIDDQERLRITDFGLAKPMDGSGDLTMTGRLLGSPNYLSPEQVGGSEVRLTPSSDVYAMGAILYELLAGRPPFLAQSIPEVLLLIQSTDPAPLRSLNPQVPQDLETIAHKCLEKDPQRRYASAQELSEELQRYLCGHPIRARPLGTVEKLVRWAGRHRTTASLAAALMVTLLGATAVSLMMAVRAARAEMEARVETAISKEVLDFYHKDILKAASPYHGGTPDIRLAEVLDKASRQVNTRRFAQPMVEVAIHSAIGQAFLSLSDTSRALDHLKRSHDLLLVHRGPEHRDRIRVAIHLATTHKMAGDSAMAESMLWEVYPIQLRQFGDKDPDTLQIMASLAYLVALRTGFAPEARALYQRTLSHQREVIGTQSWITRNTLIALARFHMESGELEEATALVEEAVMAATVEHSPSSIQTFWARVVQAEILCLQGRYSQAEAVLMHLRRDQQEVLLPNHVLWMDASAALSRATLGQGRVAEAAEWGRQVWDLAPKDYRARHQAYFEKLEQSCRDHHLEADAISLRTRFQRGSLALDRGPRTQDNDWLDLYAPWNGPGMD